MSVIVKEGYEPTGILATAHTVYGVAKHLWDNKEFLMSVGSKISSYLNQKGSSSSSKKGKGKLRINSTMGSKNSFSQSTTPVAQNVQLRNTTFWNANSLPRHPTYGDAIRITGRQVMCDVVTTGSDTQLFTVASGATTINSYIISPDIIGGRLALIARTYDKFAFRYIKAYYYPRVATSQAGGFSLAYIQDGAIGSYATLDYSTIQQVDPCVVAPFRESASLEIVYTGPEVYFSESEFSAGTAEKRQTAQGFISGFPDASAIGAVTMGHLIIEYVCDLYQPICDLGYSVFCSSSRERDSVKQFIELYRKKNPLTPKLTFADYMKMLKAGNTGES